MSDATRVEGGGEQDGCTALFLAAQNGHLEVLQYLIDKGADIRNADKVPPRAPQHA